MFLIVNLAVGGSWPGAPDAETVFPSWFEVDYVRAYERVLGRPGAETNGGSAADTGSE